MSILRRLALVCLLVCVPSLAFAQADMSVTASDAPDPVAPDGNITYSVTVNNNGPSATTNAHLNIFLNGSLLYQSSVIPAGWNCGTLTVGSGAPITCTAAALAPSTSNFTIVLKAPAATFGINDTTITQNFSVNSALPDPNPGNDSVNVSTAYVAPDADMQITASDSPDPVAPDGNITYTVNVTNAGPDTAVNARMNMSNDGTLLYQSSVIPAGWNCGTLTVGSGAPITCTNPTFPSASMATFSIVLKAPIATLGINDTTITRIFGTNSDISDPNHTNDTVNVSTAYVAPDADMQISASDAPDPVFPDGNITYTVNVTNAGPDTAVNARMNMSNDGTLLYQSSVIPAGWNCGTLTVGSGAPITCTNPSLPSGGMATFSIVLKAPIATLGINDTTITRIFGTNSDISDPNHANDTVNVSTAYVSPDADMQISASDAPDPVAPDGNITYTVNVTNAGPDAAPNARMNMSNDGTLLYQSSVIPAGWNCGTLTVGSGAPITCTNPSLASGGMATFSIVMKAPIATLGINDTTIVRTFGTNSDVSDPNHNNDTVNVSTAYVAPDADMQITASDAPDPVAPDGNITYTVNVTNAGPDTAVNARMNMSNDGTLLYQSSVIPAGWNCGTLTVGSGAPITCTNPSFPSASMATFSIVMKAAIATVGLSDTTIVRTFGTNSDVADPNHTNDTVNVSTAYAVPDADLGITAADAPDPVVPGNNITFTISIGSAGPDAAANTVVTVPLHASLRFVSITPVAGFNCNTPAIGATGTITCTNASFPNGGAGTFTLVAQVDPALLNGPSGSIIQNFTIGSDTHDPVIPNNSAQTTTAYQTPAVADLSITKSTQATTVAPGGTITYTITAHNNGPSAATNVVVTDALPASLLFQSIVAPAGFNCSTPAAGANGTITCNAASLANGATAVFTLNTTVANNATGTITNNATISATETDGASGNNGGSSAPLVVGPAVGGTPIPTLSEWALLALAALLGLVAVTRK